MKNQLSLLLGVFITVCGFSQTNNFWTKNLNSTQDKNISSTKNNTETSYQNTYNLSVEKLKEVLSHCPKRSNSFGQSNVIITLPSEDGKFKEYRIKETSVLHPDLAKKFPDIKSYLGTPVNGGGGVVHFSLGHNNFRAMIMKPDATITDIKPSTSNSKTYRIASKTDESEPINCQIIDNEAETFSEKSTKQAEKSNKARRDANDGRVRVYRMAIAVTGELSKIYTDAANITNGSTQQRKVAVLAALNELMTRVNAVYERDLGTTFELVPNIENSIFLNPVTDGFTHGNTSASVNEVQAILDATIGNANYDIGHVLDSDGTGRGALRSVCDDSKKAQGATGAHPFTSVNDYFYRTFVHEIGHQFGANHSFNNSCGGNRLDEGAVEPGGGNSIMAYQGCAPNYDLRLSYVFFHAKQIDEMWNHILSVESCATLRSIGNSAPVASIGGNYTIPRSTPFILEGSATDANASDQLTYTWDQMDKEIAPMPPRATSTNGPVFRFKPPSTSPIRYMPDISTVKAGNASSEWEVTPSVSRTMNFRYTVRDNHPGGGNTDSKDAVITVSGNAGPFVVTSQNTRFNAAIGSTQTVTWNVAGTTGNGVNAANVDILLSTDGGNTYPITLASAVPNDGSHQVTIPNNEGGVNRIMVRGTNNIFFDITNANFSIGNSDPMPTNYCAAGYQGTNYIAEVIFADINNKSENGGYSDFTNLGTNITKGESVTLTVNPGIESWEPNYFGAWIDWNKDGDFEDVGEEVLLTTNGAGGVTTTVVVPNTAKNGATRLRVRYKIHTAPEPCGTTRTNGDEVEDYFVFIKGGGTTNPTCNDGIQNGNETGVDCGGPDCDPCTVNPTCNDGIQNGNETGVDCGGDCTPCNTNVTYCNAGRQGTNYVAEVTFGSISNTSQNSAYSDFTSQSTSVQKGASVTLTVTPGIVASNWNSNVVGGWIDWNQDGDFEDPGEEVLMKPRGTGSGSATVVIPNNAKNGSTRLRVRYRWSSNPSPCGTREGDEVEDYTVIVGGTTTPTCTDGIQNGNETGIDCGGSCAPCNNDGTVVYVDIEDKTTNASNSWNFFRIEVGDDNGFGGWFSNSSLRFVTYGKDLVCQGTTSNVTLIGEGIEVGASNNFVSNSNSFVVSSSSYSSWNGKSGYIGFKFLIGGKTHYGWFYATVANNGLSYTIKDYAYNTTENQGLVTKRPSAFKLNASENEVNLYPNPFKNTFTIDVSKLDSDRVTVSVYDILGKKLTHRNYSKNPGKITLGEQIKESGNYFIKIQTNTKVQTVRVVRFK